MNTCDKKYLKLGKIRVSTTFLHNEWLDMAICLKGFMPFKIEIDESLAAYEMTGYCMAFDAVEEGSKIPIYTVEVTARYEQGACGVLIKSFDVKYVKDLDSVGKESGQ